MIKFPYHKATIFVDLDGTLVETDLANRLAYEKAIRDVLGRSVSLDKETRVNREAVKTKLGISNLNLFTEVIKKKESHFSDFLPQSELKQDTHDFLLKVRDKNKIILVSKCREKRAQSVLKYHGIECLFNNFYFLEELLESGSKNKFEGALRKFNIDPSKVIVIENEDIEIKSAMKAGISRDKIFKV